MKKKIACIALLSLLVFPVLGQGRTEKVQSVSLYLLGVECSLENPIAPQWTLRTHGGVDGGFGWSSNLFTPADGIWYYSICATAGVDLRYYYNLSRRQEKGRSTALNSGNFFGVGAQYFTPLFRGT